MTAEELNAAISEIIIPCEKPRRKKFSYFRKKFEKRRLKNFLPPQNLSAIYNNTPHISNFLSYGGYFFICLNGCIYCTKNGRGNFGVRQNLLTGRFKTFKNCQSRRRSKYNRTLKYLRHKHSRSFKGEISNGAAYKKL